jgi:tetratricopeptide (TPR) repeat protein/predicted aspartyl protease
MSARELRTLWNSVRRVAAAASTIAASTIAALIIAATTAGVAHAGECQMSRYAEMPVTMNATRPLLAGSINGISGQFDADSGSFFSMLSHETAERLKLRVEPLPGNLQVRGASGVADVGMTHVKELTINGFGTAHNVDFLVGGNSFAAGLLGALGQNVIGHADTEYDLANGVIRLFHTRDCGKAMLAYWHGTSPVSIVQIHEITPAQANIVGEAMINGAKINVLFDSGAARSVLDFRAARRAGIKLDGPEVRPGGAWQGINGKSFDTWITHFDSLDVGGELIRNARLRIADIELTGGADMLLGADFFLSHRIFVSASTRRVFFTYNGGHVFDLGATTAGQQVADTTSDTPSDAPTDAAGFRRRASALMARQDYAAAAADLTRAIELEPDDAESYHQRGLARWQSGDAVQAAADFDEALQRKPDDIAVLMDRGRLRLVGKQQELARVDFERVSNLAPNDATLSLQIATIYQNTGHWNEAISRLDRWVNANPRDDRLPAALAERCWARALLGTELDRAVSDCDSALNRGQRNARNLDGRALVWLRMGKYDKSIADYRASLELQPRSAESRFGLGLAEFKKGQRDTGDADMKAAVEAQAGIAGEFKHLGLMR